MVRAMPGLPALPDIRAETARRVLQLTREGFSIGAIARRLRISTRRVRRDLKTSIPPPPVDEPDPDSSAPFEPRLILDFGTSAKPLPALSCVDVHPCRRCAGSGVLLDLLAALWRSARTEPVYFVVCAACNGSGLAEPDESSRFCCAVCHRSGLDYLPALDRWNAPAPDHQPPQGTVYNPPADGLRGGLGALPSVPSR